MNQMGKYSSAYVLLGGNGSILTRKKPCLTWRRTGHQLRNGRSLVGEKSQILMMSLPVMPHFPLGLKPGST